MKLSIALLGLLSTALLFGCSSSDAPASSAPASSAPATSGAGGAAGATTNASGATTSTGGQGTGGASGYQPDPIPAIDPEPPAACAAALADPNYFQFLDNRCSEKRTPSKQDRARACPSVDTSAQIPLTGGGVAVYQPSSVPVVFDDQALSGVVPPDLDITVILIRRVGGVPHYRYLSNGTHDIAYQPWSSTKFMAAANAASTLRIQSSYDVGLTGSVDGHPLGDLVTSLVSYDDMPYSSNSLGRYFHNIGGRQRANDLIHALWLGRPAAETFGGNYGEVEPPLGYQFVEQGGGSVVIQPDLSAGNANHLSSATTAEALKRLVLHREEPTQRLPGIQWSDVEVLLYGAEGSTKGLWGGMSADTAIYLQSGHDVDYIEQRSHGQWMTFSKLGLGTQGEFLNVGYSCLPVLDPAGQPVEGWGRELVIATHLPTGGATWAERDRNLARYYRSIVTRVVDGRL